MSGGKFKCSQCGVGKYYATGRLVAEQGLFIHRCHSCGSTAMFGVQNSRPPDIDLYLCSDSAKELLAKGFVGNGCGSAGGGWKKTLLGFLLRYIFGFLLEESCKRHDAEYSLSRTIKSRPRKLKADIDFQINLELELMEYPENFTPRRRMLYERVGYYRRFVDWAIRNIPRLFHAAVVAGGQHSYWQ